MTAPGWYADPQTPGQLRFWDGARWTEHSHPLAAPPSAGYGFAIPGAPANLADAPGVDAVGAPVNTGSAWTAPPGMHPPAARRSRGRRVLTIAGICVAGAAVLTVGLVALDGTGAFDKNETASDGPTRAPALDRDPAAGPTARPLVPNGGFVVPAGMVEVSPVDSGVRLAVPETWTDVTEDARSYYGVTPEEQTPGERDTYLGAWAIDGDLGTANNVVWAYRVDLTQVTPIDYFFKQVQTTAASTWSQLESSDVDKFVTTLGLPGRSVTWQPHDDQYSTEFNVWVLGGGSNAILAYCDAAWTSGGCESAASVIDTVWIAP